MSIQLMTQVWQDATLTGNTRMVLLALADSANDEGTCWPLIDTIARKVNCSRSTVESALANLERQGYLERNHRRNSSTIYRVLIPTPENRGSPENYGDHPRESGVLTPENRTQNRKGTVREPSGGAYAPDGGLWPPPPEQSPPAKKQARRKQRHHLPDDWVPKDQHVEKARTLGVDLEEEAEKFRNYWQAQGKPMADWDATFRNWLLNARKFQSSTQAEPTRDKHGRIVQYD